jgi:hypothetical protein
MSESLEERLSRFTPEGTGLDRDALLFAAGQASVRPGRRWPILAAVLTASQVLTLALLWPRPTPPAPAPALVSVPGVSPAPAQPSVPPDPSELGVLRQRMLSGDGDLPRPAPIESLVAADPPWSAFSAARAGLADRLFRPRGALR